VNPYQQGDTFDPRDIAWVLSDNDLARCVEALNEAESITFDWETTGLDEHAPRARVVMASFTVPLRYDLDGTVTNWVVPLSHPDGPFCGKWRVVFKRLVRAMAHAGNLEAWNGKFDLRWAFAHTGIDLSGHLVWDGQVVAHLLDENESTRLKEVAPRLFGIEAWNDGIDFREEAAAERVPLFHLGEYAARDTYWTYRVGEAQRLDLDTEEQPETADEVEAVRLGKFVSWCVMPMVRNLAAVEQRGIALDGGWVRDQIALDSKTRDETLEALLALNPLDGTPSFAPTSLWFRAWADQAVERGQLRVDAITPNGKPQWSRHVLARQARQGLSPLPGELLIYRQAVKRLEFLNAWLDLQANDGRLHPRYNVGRVITGRLSSADPNMQQVTKALKPAFVPAEGYLIAEIDYSQIELRAAAYIARCQPMIDAYTENRDLHLAIAATLHPEETLRTANLYLMRNGLPPNGTGAEVLRIVRSVTPPRLLSETLVRLSSAFGADQDARSREWWRATRGEESRLEGRDIARAVQALPEELLRALREDFERLGWPWEGDSEHAGRASSEPRPLGQPAGEPYDAVQVVSSAGAPALEEVSGYPWSKWRQLGKASNFGLIYGQSPAGFRTYAETAYGVELTAEEAQATWSAFFEQWPGMYEWQMSSIKRARATGQVVSPLGRVRRVPNILDGNPHLQGEAERQAVNSPVQSFASDLMQMAAADVMGQYGKPVPGVRMIGTVHDSLVVEVPADDWQRAVARVMHRMINPHTLLRRLDCDLDVPLGAEASVGSRWGLKDVGVIVS
jgi:DNA polymerase I-like protein with 3'-5' exonuclease and polymerase domains